MALADRTTTPDAADTGSMGFLEHLEELRARLIRSCIAIAAGMAIAWSFVERIALFILGPTIAVMPPGSSLQTTRPGEGFAFHLDVAFIVGLLIASPYVLFQIWRFIAPGLHSNEKRLALPFVVMGVAGALGGAAFCHYLLFPATMGFLASFDEPYMRWAPRVEDTFAQYKHMLIAMIAVFQVPNVVFYLARLRLVTARFLWRHLRYATLFAFIAAAFLTPTADAWSQLLMAGPLVGMYVLSIGIAWLAAPRRRSEPNGMPPIRLVVAAGVLVEGQRRARRRLWLSPRRGRLC
jgi:sec-independent protein translocase protein TatC